MVSQALAHPKYPHYWNAVTPLTLLSPIKSACRHAPGGGRVDLECNKEAVKP